MLSGLILAVLLCQATTSAVNKDWPEVIRATGVLRATPSTYNHLEYLQACAYHGLGEKRQATLHAKNILDSFHPVERRHEIVAEIILRDVATWKEGDLGDIDRLMTRATDELKNRRAPVDTQKEILDKLDRLIKEQEEPPPSSKPEPGSDKNAPAPESFPMPGDDGKGQASAKAFKKLKETWGTLPEKERVRVMAEIQRSIPDKYKSMVEQYYKSLGKQ